MGSSAHDRKTIQFYDREAARYADWSGRERSYILLDRLVERLPRGSKVLDAGCGAGWDSERFAAAGLRTVSIDASAGLVAEANRRPGVTAAHMRFDQLKSDQEFDAVWANSALQHVDRPALPGVLSILSGALKIGGYFFAAAHRGTVTRRDSLGRLYCHYTRDELSEHLRGAGLEILSVHSAKSLGFDGSAIISLLVESRRSASSNLPIHHNRPTTTKNNGIAAI